MYTLLVTGDVPGASTYFNPLLQQTIIPCTSGTRPTPVQEGMHIYETDTDRMLKWTSITWEVVSQSRTAYTPALTASTTNPTLGTGSAAAGFYSQANGWVQATFNILFGTSGAAAGSGGYKVSLPVTATAVFGNGNTGMGSCLLRDSSASTAHGGTIAYDTTTTVRMFDDTTGQTVTDAQAWTWANNDSIGGTLLYPT